MREPERERFRVIINELGITLAGRGQDLQDIIDRFDPTLKEVNQILKILAKQNKNLVRMAEDGDAALREMADNREHITGLFREADKTARAVNEKRAKFEETLSLIPDFLDELEPTAAELKRLSEEAAPVAASTKVAAKDLSTFVTELNDFVNAANPALKKLRRLDRRVPPADSAASADRRRSQPLRLVPVVDHEHSQAARELRQAGRLL